MQISETKLNFIIIQDSADFSAGLLFAHNIHYCGHPISLPFSLSILEDLRTNPALLEVCAISSRFGRNGEFAILTLDCSEILREVSIENTLQPNKIYKGVVIANNYNISIVSVNGQYGFIEGIIEEQIGDTIYISPLETGNSKLEIARFSRVVNDEPSYLHDIEQTSINEFLDKEELEVISEEDRTTIEFLLERIGDLNRNNINVVRERLDLCYRSSTQLDLHNFLSERPHYFEENNFWISCYPDNGDIKLIIYDVCNVVLEIQVNAQGMWICEFSHDKNKTNAQFLIDKNQNALVIPGRNIVFHSGIFVKDNYVEIGELIYAQREVAKKLLPKLHRTVKEAKEKAGVDYLILRELLSFQEQKEKEFRDRISVRVGAENTRITSSEESDSSAIEIFGLPEVGKLFSQSDSDECFIELLCGDEAPRKARLKESPQNGCFIIEFYHTHFSLDNLRQTGFEIRRTANINHLRLQQDAITKFVDGRDFDIFRKLKRGEINPIEHIENVAFFDNKFNNVEDGNNQPLAIRKAVSSEDILLIQGPPGTGKTSVIVEIIKQLVINKGERVLVCSQAHSAVKNIYDRLVGCDERIRIGNIDVEETMISEDIKDHPQYLKNSMLLLNQLQSAKKNDEKNGGQDLSRYVSDYSTDASKKRYLKEHENVCQYFETNTIVSVSDYHDIINELKDGIIDLGDDAVVFNNARHYQSLNVLMGTCIGIGMDYGLKRSGILFDTVIIDEAGKANLAEATVPMQLGKKYILVGDQRQLPPYMDREEVKEFIEGTTAQNLTQTEVESAISYSLFEDFLDDEKFPKENTVLLNYQYRMNPEIGDYISELFYGNELRHGKGTERQTCVLDGFPDAVTFIDTSTNQNVDGRNIAFEQGNPQDGWYNLHEIEIIIQSILPKISSLQIDNPSISVGFITPYRKQRQLLLQQLKETQYKGKVFTIDSIQGTEFDIVVLSLVRAFNANWGNRTVGFLDDMRRLNVALSRAKKKLIIIGNLDTLCSSKSHLVIEDKDAIVPVEVFRKLKEIKQRSTSKTSLAILKEAIKSGTISNGYIFHDCEYKVTDEQLYIKLDLNGKKLDFPIAYNSLFKRYGLIETFVNVKFLCIDDDGRAKFEYMPKIPISQQIEDGFLYSFKAEPLEWIDSEKGTLLVRLQDSSETIVNIRLSLIRKSFLYSLLDSPEIKEVCLHKHKDGNVTLDKGCYVDFQNNHKIDENVKIIVIDDFEPNYYIVRCDDVYGIVFKKGCTIRLQKGSVTRALIKEMGDGSIVFKV